MVDALGKDEQQAIFKVIDLAISNKKMDSNFYQPLVMAALLVINCPSLSGRHNRGGGFVC